MLTLAFNIKLCLFVNEGDEETIRNLIEEDSSQCLKILSQDTVKKTKID